MHRARMHLPIMKMRHGYALNAGATPEEHLGFPRAFEAANAFKELFDRGAEFKGGAR